MVRLTPYVGDPKLYENYYCSQAGRGLPVFIGGRSLRGRGLGNILGGIGRSLIPLLKSGGKALLKEGAQTGMQVARDVLSGQSVKSAVKRRAKDAGKRLFHQAVGSVLGGEDGPPGKRIKSSTPRVNKHRAPRRQRRTKDIFQE